MGMGRFCADCKHNVVTAFDILTCKCDLADIDTEDEFLPDLFWPFAGKIGPFPGDATGQKALLSCPLEVSCVDLRAPSPKCLLLLLQYSVRGGFCFPHTSIIRFFTCDTYRCTQTGLYWVLGSAAEDSHCLILSPLEVGFDRSRNAFYESIILGFPQTLFPKDSH